MSGRPIKRTLRRDREFGKGPKGKAKDGAEPLTRQAIRGGAMS